MDTNKEVLRMHNEGLSVRVIADTLKISKDKAHRIIKSVILPGNDPKEPTTTSKPKQSTEYNSGDRFSSFVGWSRIDVNEYVNDKTSEVIKVRFVEGVDGNEVHFVIA